MFKIVLLMSTILTLVGCQNNHPNIDDTSPTRDYFAISDFTDQDGWQSFVLVTINEDDIVTGIRFDGITWTANGTRSEIAQLGAYEAHFGYHFYEQANTLEQHLVGVSRSELVGRIHEAAANSLVDFDLSIFANLANLAIHTTSAPRGAYLDGAYRAFGDIYEDDYQLFTSLFVINGYIVAAHFNGLSSDGTLQFNHLGGETVTNYAIGMREQFEYFEQILIAVQDPMSITFDAEGFAIDFPQLHIPVQPLVALVIEALGAGPVVD